MSDVKVQILSVDDEPDIQSSVMTLLRSEGFELTEASDGVEAINILQKKQFDLVLLDINMPKVDGIEVLEFVKEKYPTTEAIMLTAVTEMKTAVECMNKGAFYYINKPFASAELLHIVRRALEHRRITIENRAIRSELSRVSSGSEIIGKSKLLLKALNVAERVAPTHSSVLIQGASGTGKELVANFIFRKSLRADEPFVALNCASIPDTLIESELFGYEKGAFTDARTQKMGLVEIANKGTLFLDEVGDISPVFQPKLLRFIQTGEFRRIGGTLVLHSDVRIICATNKDLRKEVEAGRFREDLLYRLNVITVTLPSLRDRREDIPLLIENFLSKRLPEKNRKEVSPRAMEILMKYDWPGNARELENIIEGAIILSEGSMIEPQDLSLPIGRYPVMSDSSVADRIIGSSVSIKSIEKMHIAEVLKSTNWDKNATAKILGISLKTLYSKIAQYNIVQH